MSHFFWAEKAGEGWETMVLIRQKWPHKTRRNHHTSGENTTWFDNGTQSHDVYMITDFEGDLLICELGYAYPVRIYGLCRADIGFDRGKAQDLKNLYA